MSSTTKLLPCPFCSNADISIRNENPKDNSGGYFIECPGCGASTALRFACGDDPTHLLAEQWNRRTASHCLHQIQEPDPVQAAPRLDDAWKARMLDGQALVRDKDGIGFHPALPDFDEGVKSSDFFAALGIELKGGMAENEMDSEAYEAMTGNGLTDDGDSYNVWTPKRPEGDGWNLVAVFDTEDGPACWWMRDMPFAPQRAEGYSERVDNAAVEVLSMNMKAKLAGQRAKGYRGWNNDCTQQRLSDLLRDCVEKGDPVDVANFCAFLLARGETIAPRAGDAATFEQRMSDWQHGDALDATRYRWLRSRDLKTISQGGVFAGMTPQNVILNEEDLDQAVDAAIEAEKGE